MKKRGNKGPVRPTIFAAIAFLMIASCKPEQAPMGFESPSATIDSLFRAYDVHDISQEEARRRLQARERFSLVDVNLFRQCFADWQGEHDHALGGFVFGQLVAAKEDLEIDLDEDVALVRVAPQKSEMKPIVIVKRDRAWKIDLRQSIEPQIRQSLYEVYRRARRAERQAR